MVLVIFSGGFLADAWADGPCSCDCDFRDEERCAECGEYENEKDELLEEISEFLGWTVVTLAVAAGALFPLRRMSKPLMELYPQTKNTVISGLRWLRVAHIPMGFAIVVLSVVHGGIGFFYGEEPLGSTEWLGIGALLLVVPAFIWGVVLWKKKRFPQARNSHAGLFLVAGLLAGIHVLFS
jgi:uncharacterized membrane protein